MALLFRHPLASIVPLLLLLLAAAAAATQHLFLPPVQPPAAFTPSAYLPPLLTFDNGSAVRDSTAWAARRDEIKTLLQVRIPTGP